MNMSITTIEYFKTMSDESGISYQVLMNYYLDDCVKQQKKIQWVGTSEKNCNNFLDTKFNNRGVNMLRLMQKNTLKSSLEKHLLLQHGLIPLLLK